MAFDFGQLDDIDFSGLESQPVEAPAVEPKESDEKDPRVTTMEWLGRLREKCETFNEKVNIHPTMGVLILVDEVTGKTYSVTMNMTNIEKIAWLEITKHSSLE